MLDDLQKAKIYADEYKRLLKAEKQGYTLWGSDVRGLMEDIGWEVWEHIDELIEIVELLPE